MTQAANLMNRTTIRMTQTTSERKRVALIPAFNEARFIGSVVLQAQQYVDHVVVVNDGSYDNTAQTARAAGAEVLNMPQNVGKARAVSEGIRYIRKLQPSSVVMIDGDGQHDPNQIPNLLAPIEEGEADIVIGSRFIGIKSHIPRWRIIGQHTLTLATNIASGVYSTDSQSGFRAFSPQALPYLDFHAEGFSVESEMQFIMRENGLRLAEVPISVVYEEPSKRNPIRHALQVLNGVLRLVGQMRPLFFFGLPGLLTFVGGLVMGFWVVELYKTQPVLPIGYTLISVLLCLIGIISLSTGVILHSMRAFLTEWLERTAVPAS
jgi:glycosyltransferase involved in cell wall biosynthesis